MDSHTAGKLSARSEDSTARSRIRENSPGDEHMQSSHSTHPAAARTPQNEMGPQTDTGSAEHPPEVSHQQADNNLQITREHLRIRRQTIKGPCPGAVEQILCGSTLARPESPLYLYKVQAQTASQTPTASARGALRLHPGTACAQARCRKEHRVQQPS
jgi:hypothetical protein